MKKQIRKMTNRTAGYIFFYNLIMIAVMFGAIVIMTIAAMAKAGSEQAADRAVDALGRNMDALLGTLSIAGVCGGLLFLGIVSCRKGLVREMFRRKKRMEARTFVRIFCVFMACQMIFTVAALLAELALNPFGLTLKEAAESASAVGAGLVFGYVAVEYSIGWSILIHILNNLVFSDLLGRLAGALPETAGALLEYGVSGFFFLAVCVILVREREKIVLWWRRNRPPRRYWLWAFTTFWVILFLLAETAAALGGVSRL